MYLLCYMGTLCKIIIIEFDKKVKQLDCPMRYRNQVKRILPEITFELS